MCRAILEVERKSHGSKKIIYKTTMRNVRGDSSFHRVGYIEEGNQEGIGGGGEGNKEVLAKLDGISTQLLNINRQVGRSTIRFLSPLCCGGPSGVCLTAG